MDPASERGTDATRLLGIVAGSWKSQAVHVAARLGIADLLAPGPSTAEALAAQSGAHVPSLRRLLRALTTIELVRENEDGSFELAPMGALLREDASDSLRAWVLHWGGSSWAPWGQLLHSIMTGESARSHLDADPGSAETFHRAMTELTRLVAHDFVRTVDWTGARKIVDVGGGYGELLAAALTASPGSVGILYDRSQAVEGGRLHLRAAGLEHRCQFLAGDFFDWVPRDADTYLLKSILHDWNDARAAEILASCRRAIAPDGRLLVVERIVPQRLGASDDDQGLACIDLHMLVQHGARERTEADLRGLLSATGFRTTSVKPLRATLSLIEAVPSGDDIA